MEERIQLPESLEEALRGTQGMPSGHELAIAKARTWQNVVKKGRRFARRDRWRPWLTGIAAAACVALGVAAVPSYLGHQQDAATSADQALKQETIYDNYDLGLKILREGNGISVVRNKKTTHVFTVHSDDSVKGLMTGPFLAFIVYPAGSSTGQAYFIDSDNSIQPMSLSQDPIDYTWVYGEHGEALLTYIDENKQMKPARVIQYNTATHQEKMLAQAESRDQMTFRFVAEDQAVGTGAGEMRVIDLKTGEVTSVVSNPNVQNIVLSSLSQKGFVYKLWSNDTLVLKSYMYLYAEHRSIKFLPGLEGDINYIGQVFPNMDENTYLVSAFVTSPGVTNTGSGTDPGTLTFYLFHDDQEAPQVLYKLDTTRHMANYEISPSSSGGKRRLMPANGKDTANTKLWLDYDPATNAITPYR
ncbi:hypothetical protein [Tumebacillus flagellatus]|uniref:Uncharacterized protein n=1 Tax=Tumebacillus flagellatus TaxID=1157490 RepID=A0A074LX80_9BACL|nr:hypothetical protein [Tumebacillus flagellatus]KEO84658.1 hypothetical protein EL26_03835 [Tumebacillus flagellatus]